MLNLYFNRDMADTAAILPGQIISPSELPPLKKNVLTLGPGLRHVPPSNIVATAAGTLSKDARKGAVWLETDGRRYTATTGDLVVAQVHHSATEVYYCMLAPHVSNAVLGHLSFEAASRKTRPQLKAGDLLYARVSRAVKGEDVEIECVNSATGKSDGLGPLKGGMTFDVSLAFARRLMQPGGQGGIVILNVLGEKLRFEIAVGRNGIIWLDSTSIKATITIGRLLTEADTQNWSIEQQQAAVKSALKSLPDSG